MLLGISAILNSMFPIRLSQKPKNDWSAASVLIAYFVRLPVFGGLLLAVALVASMVLDTSSSIALPIPIAGHFLGGLISVFFGTLVFTVALYPLASPAALVAGLAHIAVRRLKCSIVWHVLLISVSATIIEVIFLIQIGIHADLALSSLMTLTVVSLFSWYMRSSEKQFLSKLERDYWDV